MLLNSEVNSPTNSNGGGAGKRVDEIHQIEQRELKSRNNSFLFSDDSEDCNSRCSSPCQNPQHIGSHIFNIVQHFNTRHLFSNKEGGLLNKLMTEQKPKSMITMFMHAQKVKKENGEELLQQEQVMAHSKLDVNKYFLPTSIIQLHNVSQFNLPGLKFGEEGTSE